MRRKTAFLLNALLIRSDKAPITPSLASAALHTEPARALDPVHANSHASMLRDPKSTDTSRATQQAFAQHGILSALVEGLVRSVPHGADGDSERDLDFEEKVVA